MKATLKISESGRGGFTLLEVMVAMAIISASLIVLLQSHASNIARVHHSSALTKAAILAQKILADTDSAESIVIGEWEGREEAGSVVLSWKKLVEPSVVENIVKVTLLVSWGEEGRNIPFMLETYRAL